jgi:hypothetical protein
MDDVKLCKGLAFLGMGAGIRQGFSVERLQAYFLQLH